MRKLYLLAILALFSSQALHSQSFTLTDIHFSGDPTFFMEGHATVNNISSTPKDVAVQRTVNNLFPGHNGYFCWVQCYSNTTNISPDNFTIAPGSNTDIFRGDLETNSISGISVVSYCFFDANNPSDSVCTEYIYDATTGLAEIATGKNYISKAFPNPATTNTNFYINVAKSGKTARLKFFNMLGAQVKEVAVAEGKNSVKVSVNDLKAGIYFYSLWVDGKSSSTGKLMVSKN